MGTRTVQRGLPPLLERIPLQRRYLCHSEGSVIFRGPTVVKVIAPIMEAQLGRNRDLKHYQPSVFDHRRLFALSTRHRKRRDDGIRSAPRPGIDGVFTRHPYGQGQPWSRLCRMSVALAKRVKMSIPVLGHMHSWIMSFPDEYTAFKEYARLYLAPVRFVGVHTTHCKISVPNAISCISEMKDAGIHPKVTESVLIPAILPYQKGTENARWSVDFLTQLSPRQWSDDLNFDQRSENSGSCHQTKRGVGTNLITSKDCPSFEGFSKLAAIQNKDGNLFWKSRFPKNWRKINQSRKQNIYRIYDKDAGKSRRSNLAFCRWNWLDTHEDLLLFDPIPHGKDTAWRRHIYNERILKPIFIKRRM